MAETYGFFDAEELLDGTFDREYVAQQWADYFRLFVGNGVFATPTNQLKTLSVSGMRIKVLEGWAFLNGYWYHNDGDLEITVPPNLTANTLHHGVFVQFNSSDRTIGIVLGENRTEVDRVPPIWELKIAEVAVAAGATSISDANITDTRSDNSVCGFVTGIIDVINTEDLFAQYQSIFTEWFTGVEADEAEKSSEFDTWRQNQEDSFTAWISQSENDFDVWFDNMKGQLSTDAAGHLQQEVDVIDGTIANRELTSTASRSYSTGEVIFYDGNFYNVVENVTLGDTWDNTSGGNIELMEETLTELLRLRGDMFISEYDSGEDVKDAGGIVAYVDDMTDDWTEAQVLSVGDSTVTFEDLDPDYSYDAWFDCADGYAPPVLDGPIIFNGTTATVSFSSVTANQVGSGETSACKIWLRIVK